MRSTEKPPYQERIGRGRVQWRSPPCPEWAQLQHNQNPQYLANGANFYHPCACKRETVCANTNWPFARGNTHTHTHPDRVNIYPLFPGMIPSLKKQNQLFPHDLVPRKKRQTDKWERIPLYPDWCIFLQFSTAVMSQVMECLKTPARDKIQHAEGTISSSHWCSLEEKKRGIVQQNPILVYKVPQCSVGLTPRNGCIGFQP